MSDFPSTARVVIIGGGAAGFFAAINIAKGGMERLCFIRKK